MVGVRIYDVRRVVGPVVEAPSALFDFASSLAPKIMRRFTSHADRRIARWELFTKTPTKRAYTHARI